MGYNSIIISRIAKTCLRIVYAPERLTQGWSEGLKTLSYSMKCEKVSHNLMVSWVVSPLRWHRHVKKISEKIRAKKTYSIKVPQQVCWFEVRPPQWPGRGERNNTWEKVIGWKSWEWKG